MGRPGLLFAALAVLALGYGMTRHAGISVPAAPSASMPQRGEQAAERAGKREESTVAPPGDKRVVPVEHLPLAGPSQGAELPELSISLDIESDDPPIDHGEPLHVDDDWSSELALTQDEPVDIGSEWDANDPLVWMPDVPSEAPVDIGTPLDPDDPESFDETLDAEESVEIGSYLDAGDPSGWEPDEAASDPIEIGASLDAGAGAN